MKAWWQQLNTREQQLVSVMGGLVIIFLFYSLIWQPLNDDIANGTKKLAKQQELLAWVEENTALYKQAQGSSGNARSRGSISSIANRSAKTYKLSITRVQPQGDDLQVWIDSTSFTQLLFWLEHLSNKEGLRVKSLDLTKSDRAGEVTVRRLHLTKS